MGPSRVDTLIGDRKHRDQDYCSRTQRHHAQGDYMFAKLYHHSQLNTAAGISPLEGIPPDDVELGVLVELNACASRAHHPLDTCTRAGWKVQGGAGAGGGEAGLTWLKGWGNRRKPNSFRTCFSGYVRIHCAVLSASSACSPHRQWWWRGSNLADRRCMTCRIWWGRWGWKGRGR